MSFRAKEKKREAASRSPFPSSMDMFTDAPVATILERASAMRTTGIIRFTAARASSPRNLPTKMPSATDATAAGTAQWKKSLVGGSFAYMLDPWFMVALLQIKKPGRSSESC